MGPRSRDRGIHKYPASKISFRRASMGPRSRDRGIWKSLLEENKRKDASMGPRSRDRGIGPGWCSSYCSWPRFNGAAVT